ncbi:hypothetical protein UY3_13624 [Chelonia mydas]|uniref:Coiled-coil domain-containing protein 102B n=1 Tax=Chelonia mydas TaxID=8469 RepID=M7AV02_CHEMY|nr:hypothetical protein UY3_13624 [Chelonia mydas]
MQISNNNDWEISEELRLRELEEVKARAAQMEKTMRWWSDCTANWREKWSKVRAERNKAREEGRQLRIKLETTMKELNALKKLNQDLLIEKEEWETEVTWKKKPNFSEMPCITEKEYPFVCLEQEPVKDVIKNKILVVQETHKEVETTENTLRKNQGTRFNLSLPDSFASDIGWEKPRQRLDNIVHPQGNELIHVSALHLQLDESQKVLQKEREMHFSLEKEVEKLRSDLSQWKWKYEEMQQSKLESLKQRHERHRQSRRGSSSSRLKAVETPRTSKPSNPPCSLTTSRDPLPLIQPLGPGLAPLTRCSEQRVRTRHADTLIRWSAQPRPTERSFTALCPNSCYIGSRYIVVELNILHDLHQNEVERNFENIEDETGARSNMDRKMCELRAESDKEEPQHAPWWAKPGEPSIAPPKWKGETGRGSTKGRPCSSVGVELPEEMNASCLLLEPAEELPGLPPQDWPEVPGLLADQDAEELLGLPPVDWTDLPGLPADEMPRSCWGCCPRTGQRDDMTDADTPKGESRKHPRETRQQSGWELA